MEAVFVRDLLFGVPCLVFGTSLRLLKLTLLTADCRLPIVDCLLLTANSSFLKNHPLNLSGFYLLH